MTTPPPPGDPRPDDELGPADRQVLADLFATSLSTPDPGSSLDLDAILRAAREARHQDDDVVPLGAPPGPAADPVPMDRDPATVVPLDSRRARRRTRTWQVLGGVAAAGALVFATVQVLPNDGGGDSGVAAPYAHERPASAAPDSALDTGRGSDGAGAGEESDAAGGSTTAAESAEIMSAEPGAPESAAPEPPTVPPCAPTARSLLDSVRAVTGDRVSLDPSARFSDCGRIVVSGQDGFVLVVGEDGADPADLDRVVDPVVLAVRPLPDQDPDDVDLDLARAVLEAVSAAAATAGP